MTDDDRIALVHEYISVAHEHSRVAAAEQFLADDATVTLNGRELTVPEYLARVEESDRSFTPTETEVGETVVTGETVAVLARTTLEQTDQVYGVEPDGEPIEQQYAVFHTIADDEIVRLDVVVDQAARLRQLGVLSEDPVEEALQNQYGDVLARVLRHDLRNRLNVIRLLGDELAAGKADAVEAGEKIRRVVDDLLETADKVRGLEQLTIGVPVEPTTFRVDALVDPLLMRYDDDASCRSHYPDGPPTVTTDRKLLRNALGELVENAVVHNDGDHPTVTVDVREADDPRYACDIRVEDDGPGIPRAVLRPVREHRETDLLHGSGIGLWVVEWCLTRLDGDVTFEPSESGGTRVCIRLPNLE